MVYVVVATYESVAVNLVTFSHYFLLSSPALYNKYGVRW